MSEKMLPLSPCSQVREILHDAQICVMLDEITDACGEHIDNILEEILRGDKLGKWYLIACKV